MKGNNTMTISEINNKKLDSLYICIYCHKNTIQINSNNTLSKINIYTILGINKNNDKTIIYMFHEKQDTTKMWLDVFQHLKDRGLDEILFFVYDYNKTVSKTAKLIFPNIKLINSIFTITNIFHMYSNIKSFGSTHKIIRGLVLETDKEDFLASYSKFDSTYNNVIYNKLKDLYYPHILALYDYPLSIRNLLCSLNKTIEISDDIRILFSSYTPNSISEAYTKIESNIDLSFNIKSFNKKSWCLIVSDLISIYNNINFIGGLNEK